MNIYLSAHQGRREEVVEIAASLRRDRHTVSHTLVRKRYGPVLDQHLAQNAYEVLQDADAVVSLTEPPTGPVDAAVAEALRASYRHVEFGVAAAMGKYLYVVGPTEHVYHTLKGVRQFARWDDGAAWALKNDWSWLDLNGPGQVVGWCGQCRMYVGPEEIGYECPAYECETPSGKRPVLRRRRGWLCYNCREHGEVVDLFFSRTALMAHLNSPDECKMPEEWIVLEPLEQYIQEVPHVAAD